MRAGSCSGLVEVLAESHVATQWSRFSIGVRTGLFAGAQGHWAAVVDMRSSRADACTDRLPGGVELSLTGPSGGPVVLGSNEVLGDVLVPATTSGEGLFQGGQHHDEVRGEAVEHWLPEVLGVGGKHDVVYGDVYPGLGEGSHLAAVGCPAQRSAYELTVMEPE